MPPSRASMNQLDTSIGVIQRKSSADVILPAGGGEAQKYILSWTPTFLKETARHIK